MGVTIIHLIHAGLILIYYISLLFSFYVVFKNFLILMNDEVIILTISTSEINLSTVNRL